MVDIILDPSIRDWVVLPMIILMVLIGLLRHYASVLLQSDTVINKEDMKNIQIVQRAQRFRLNSKYLNPTSVAMRKQFFIATEKASGIKGILREKVKSSVMNPMLNPNGMTDMLKGNMTNMLPNVLMMGLISYFFAGFVLVKVPFSLTRGFKMMLQRGIELDTLDVSYVSTLSWYFIVMFGMRGLLSLILGEQSAVDDAKAMEMQMGMGIVGGAANPMGFDAPKAFKQERESLQLHVHYWDLENIEKRYLNESINEDTLNDLDSEKTNHSSKSIENIDQIKKSRSKFTKVTKKKFKN